MKQKATEHPLTFDGIPRRQAALRIREWIKNEVLAAGTRLPTEKELSRRLGISRPTVHRALKELEGDGWIAVKERYRVVAGPERQATPILAGTVLIITSTSPEGAIEANVHAREWASIPLGNVAAHLQRAGLDAFNILPERAVSRVPRLLEGRPSGVIAYRGTLATPEQSAQLRVVRESGVPLVVFGEAHELPDYDTVSSDHRGGAAALVRILHERGCRRILRFWTRGVRETVLPSWYAERDAGYERACRELELEVLPAQVAIAPDDLADPREDFELRSRVFAGYLAPYFQGSHPPDALLAPSDGIVPFVAAACRLLHQEPGQAVRLAGYDHYWAHIDQRAFEPYPPDATVDKQHQRIAEEMVNLLLDRIAGRLPKQAQHRSVPVKVVSAAGG